MDITTPFGSLPAAPESVDNATVILWVVSALVLLVVVLMATLWHRVTSLITRAQREADASRKHLMHIYEQDRIHAAAREVKLREVLNRNNEALESLGRWFGSGVFRAVHERSDDKR